MAGAFCLLLLGDFTALLGDLASNGGGGGLVAFPLILALPLKGGAGAFDTGIGGGACHRERE